MTDDQHDRYEKFTTSADYGALTVEGSRALGWLITNRNGVELDHWTEPQLDAYGALQAFRKLRERTRKETRDAAVRPE
jgi:hypothetical protein